MVEIQEITLNNLLIDFNGFGVKKFNFNSREVKQIIEEDLLTNFTCIKHLKSLVTIEDNLYTATNNYENIILDIKLFLKVEKEDNNMKQIIGSYLKDTFITQQPKYEQEY